MAILTKEDINYSVKLRPEARVEANFKLGGSERDKFVPNINISKWDDEFFINFNARDYLVTDEKESIVDEKIATTIGGTLHEMWPLENEKALEYCLTFASRPANTFVFDILCSKGLSWDYQPTLTLDEVANGHERPDNIVDSYAVYCDKADNQYRTGKFCHIYRWRLTDARGRQTWAKQVVEFSPLTTITGNRTGTLTITLPANFMARAEYPVQLMGAGDTFGIEAVGASNHTTEGAIWAAVATPGGAGTTTTISANIRGGSLGSHNFQCALYIDSSDVLVGTSAARTDISGVHQWWDFTIAESITAQAYAIACGISTGAGAGRIKYDVQAGEGRFDTWTYNSWADPITWTNDPMGRRYSIHCDYTAGSSGYTITAESGSYSLSGQTVGVLANRKLAADSGSFALTGTAANLLKGYSLIPESGTYNLTGQLVDLLASRKILIDSGTYNLLGTAAGLLRNYNLGMDSGIYNLSGIAADLLRGLLISTENGTFNLIGQDVSLLKDSKINIESGAYSIIGQDVALTYSPLGGYTLIAESGTYNLTGQDVSLLRNYVLGIDSGAYTSTGQDIGLLAARKMSADNGIYDITGQDAALLRRLKIAIESGVYNLIGSDVTLVYSPIGGYTLIADGGSYSILGQDAALLRNCLLNIESGIFNITGNDVDLLHGVFLDIEAGVYGLTGQDIALLYGRRLVAEAGAFLLVGQDVTLGWSGGTGFTEAQKAEIRQIIRQEVRNAMGIHDVKLGNEVAVVHCLTDGATGQYPQAEIRDNEGNVLTTIDLSHEANGVYVPATPYVMPDENFVRVFYTVYSDAGHTTENTDYAKGVDIFYQTILNDYKADTSLLALQTTLLARPSAVNIANAVLDETA